ncbi:hypothetical protein O3P69_019984 [Scylla paramamosain]|uniref:FERM domain-containing protein n=1 Tax=Scylla paramamosain TaxID=85552 RepID=A0AAW0SD49_SCYPA
MLRFFSKRVGRHAQKYKNVEDSYSHSSPPLKYKHQIPCKILLLDDTDLAFDVPKKALGQELYERVFYSMDIIEKDYFGLQYTDHNHVPVKEGWVQFDVVKGSIVKRSALHVFSRLSRVFLLFIM